MFELKDKIAVITGGGSGIGKAISLLFARQGAYVHILELNADSGQETADSILGNGGHAKIHACNVADQEKVKQVMQSIVETHQKIDILVCCAGVSHVGNLEQTSEADFDRIFSVNVKGVYNTMYSVIGQMVKQGGGVILNMASVAASVGIADRFPYSMSKGAVLTMTLSVAKDYIDKNIRCNCLSPARVHTPFVDGFLAKNYPGREVEMFEKLSKTQPIGRMAKPAEVAGLALYLCSDEASFVTGCDYLIDGGFTKLNN